MIVRQHGGIEVRPATRDEFSIVVKWARDEGWNPGLSDLDAFFAADPDGFLMGFADGEPVSSISVVRYGDDHGFLGFYIVHPDGRGKGYGMATWEAGMARLEHRTVGLDGVVAQQDNYKKSGFHLVGRNIRFSGVPGLPEAEPSDVTVVDAQIDHADQIERLDRVCFAAPRSSFLRAWVSAAPDAWRHTFAAFENGDLSGYATIRKCTEGSKIGPLFALNRQSAESLFRACCVHADAGETIILDVPEANSHSVAMAGSAGMAPVFETARMYRGAAPALPWPWIFGVTSFELG